MIIKYFRKSVYGVDKLYIADPEQQMLFQSFTGQRTISERQIENAQKLFGATFEEVLAPRRIDDLHSVYNGRVIAD